MATFDFVLDETSIGSALDPPDGYLVSLSQTAPGVPDGDPQWSAAKQAWRTGYCTLKGERDFQAIYSDRSGAWVPMWNGNVRHLITDASLNYRGRLIVQCVPRGATYTLTLSDIPVDAALPRRTSFGPHVRNEADGVWGHKS
jgi:hypothetical protein